MIHEIHIHITKFSGRCSQWRTSVMINIRSGHVHTICGLPPHWGKAFAAHIYCSRDVYHENTKLRLSASARRHVRMITY